MARPSEVTLLLRRMNRGEEEAGEELFALVYGELRRMAGQLMRDERSGHTLQATALVHEAWLKLAEVTEDEWEGRSHFLRVAARAMRNLLVDHARARAAKKLGGDRERLALDEMIAVYEDRGIDLLTLNEGLEELAEVDAQLARLVEVRFFAGLDNRETAEVLGISLRSTERAWYSARAFLRTRIGEGLEP